MAGLNLLGNDTSTEPVSDIRISEYTIQIALVDDGHIRAQALHDIVKHMFWNAPAPAGLHLFLVEQVAPA